MGEYAGLVVRDFYALSIGSVTPDMLGKMAREALEAQLEYVRDARGWRNKLYAGTQWEAKGPLHESIEHTFPGALAERVNRTDFLRLSTVLEDPGIGELAWMYDLYLDGEKHWCVRVLWVNSDVLWDGRVQDFPVEKGWEHWDVEARIAEYMRDGMTREEAIEQVRADGVDVEE